MEPIFLCGIANLTKIIANISQNIKPILNNMTTTKVVRMLNTTYKVKPSIKSSNIYGYADEIGVARIVPDNSNNGIPTFYWTAENIKDLIIILKREGII